MRRRARTLACDRKSAGSPFSNNPAFGCGFGRAWARQLELRWPAELRPLSRLRLRFLPAAWLPPLRTR